MAARPPRSDRPSHLRAVEPRPPELVDLRVGRLELRRVDYWATGRTWRLILTFPGGDTEFALRERRAEMLELARAILAACGAD